MSHKRTYAAAFGQSRSKTPLSGNIDLLPAQKVLRQAQSKQNVRHGGKENFNNTRSKQVINPLYNSLNSKYQRKTFYNWMAPNIILPLQNSMVYQLPAKNLSQPKQNLLISEAYCYRIRMLKQVYKGTLVQNSLLATTIFQ